jgi:hypothetical protein
MNAAFLGETQLNFFILYFPVYIIRKQIAFVANLNNVKLANIIIIICIVFDILLRALVSTHKNMFMKRQTKIFVR